MMIELSFSGSEFTNGHEPFDSGQDSIPAIGILYNIPGKKDLDQNIRTI